MRCARSGARTPRLCLGFGSRFLSDLVIRGDGSLNLTVEVFGLERFGRFGLFRRLLLCTLASLAAAKAVIHPFAHNALVAHERVNGQFENSSVRDTGTIYNVSTRVWLFVWGKT